MLMENAGRGCVERMLRDGVPQRVLIACGKGNNAGDGYVIARHLRNAGADVIVVAAQDESLSGDAGVNQSVWLASGEAIHPWHDWTQDDGPYDWAVDALLGTGASGPLRPPLDEMVMWLNGLSCKRLAVDLPTGLDCDTGELQSPTFRADVTCTFVAAKVGFATTPPDVLGQVEVIDIGVPRCAIDAVR